MYDNHVKVANEYLVPLPQQQLLLLVVMVANNPIE